MASTITRDTWTNDTGTPSAPNNDGTILNNAVLQGHIYDRIDAMFAGGGSYVIFTLGGKFATEAFGTHTFDASGTGGNIIRIKNTSAGAGNYAATVITADDVTSYLQIEHRSSTFATFPDASLITATGDGGMQIKTTHASGSLTVYTAAAERFIVTNEGALMLNEISSTPTAPTSNTQWQIYAKGDFFVIRFNNGGTSRYMYLDGTVTSGTWTASTSAP